MGSAERASYNPVAGVNDCISANDDVCDDGGTGSVKASCIFGSDCNDCGVRPLGSLQGRGGGVRIRGATVSFNGTSIDSNVQYGINYEIYNGGRPGGGGVDVDSHSDATFLDCQIFGNAASAFGGGFAMEAQCVLSGTWSQSAEDSNAQQVDLSHALLPCMHSALTRGEG